MSIIIDVFLDAFLDTIKLIPFLFLTYFLMEYLEHRTKAATQQMVRKAGRFGPLIGGMAGAFPRCGFYPPDFGFLCRRSTFLWERFWLFFFPPQMRNPAHFSFNICRSRYDF